MPATSLEVENLSAGYGPTRVLENVSFSVPAGARLAVLGRNGMGKTTLLAKLAGQRRRYDGKIRIGETDVTAVSSALRARAGLCYVPQMRCIFPTLTVEESLFVGLKDRPKSDLQEAYAMFPRLFERKRNLGSQLSGGEQQMLSTARTILGRQLEGLAPVICEELMKAFAELAKTGDMTILLVEQRVQSALDFADQVIVLERGRVAWSGAPAALTADHSAVERLLGVGGLH